MAIGSLMGRRKRGKPALKPLPPPSKQVKAISGALPVIPAALPVRVNTRRARKANYRLK